MNGRLIHMIRLLSQCVNEFIYLFVYLFIYLFISYSGYFFFSIKLLFFNVLSEANIENIKFYFKSRFQTRDYIEVNVGRVSISLI